MNRLFARVGMQRRLQNLNKVLFPEEDTKNIAELTSDSLRLLYSIGVPKRIETVYILLVHTYITTSIYSWILKTEALTWG